MVISVEISPQDLIPLKLKILPQGPSRPNNYKLSSGKILKRIFPSAPSSIKFLTYSKEENYETSFYGNKDYKEVAFDPKGLKILRLRRTLPHFSSNSRHLITRIHLPSWRTKTKHFNYHHRLQYQSLTSPSAKYLNTIFRHAKNLKSLIMQPECRISNLKGLRKARGLQNLSLNIEEKQIEAYPEVFKGLACLRRVTLNITSLYSTKHVGLKKTENLFKFFGFFVNLPRLEHLTIQLEEFHYKEILSMIHARKLPSFHVIRENISCIVCEESRQQGWRNYIDTLYLGPINMNDKLLEKFSSEPQKRLSLRIPECFQFDIHDLRGGSSTIKNLEIRDFFEYQNNPTIAMADPLFEFLSKTKSLENFTLTFEARFTNYSEIMNEFLMRFSQIESLENLKKLTFSLYNEKVSLPKLFPPYSNIMKNLKTLSITLGCVDLELFYYMEPLKYTESLEELEFSYSENNRERKEIDCHIPLKYLKNLKKIRLSCYKRFSERAANQLMKEITNLQNLRVLFLRGRMLMGIGSKKAEKFIGDLCGMKSLESTEFFWNEEGDSKLVKIQIEKDAVNGEMKVVSRTSGR